VSLEVMVKVWKRFPGDGSRLLCMLTLANWCNDQGGSLHPSIGTLAAYMRVSESQARRTLHSLFPKDDAALAAGDWFVRVVGSENRGSSGRARQYLINVDRLDSLPVLVPERAKPLAPMQGVASVRPLAPMQGDPLHPCKGTPSTHATLNVIEPSKKQARMRAKLPNEEDGHEDAPRPSRPTAFQRAHPELFALKAVPGSGRHGVPANSRERRP
jgi:hypothetical protein